MLQIAVKMLFGDRGKYLGIVTGIALASVLMIQQPGILISIFARTYSFITDVALPDIWVMDPMAAYLDVALAQAQKSTTEADIPTLEAGSRQAIHRLGILLAREPNALAAELSAARPLPWPEALTASGLPAELLARRPDLRRAERQLAAASADIGIATAELYPKFDLTLGLGLQASSAAKFAQAASRYWSIAPGVTVPLFDAGKRRAVIEGKRAIYDESLARYRAAFLGALEDVENALAAHYAEQTRRRALADSVQSDEEAVALATERYRRGLTSFLDVLTAAERALRCTTQLEPVGGESADRPHHPVQGLGRRLERGRRQADRGKIEPCLSGYHPIQKQRRVFRPKVGRHLCLRPHAWLPRKRFP